MKKLKNIWRLADPFPNLGYEIVCYLKTALGVLFVIFGIFFLLSPLLRKELIIFGFEVMLGPLGRSILAWEEKTFGLNFTIFSLTAAGLLLILGLWLFWQIKLVKKLIKTLFS